jgi:hypothetical protein
MGSNTQDTILKESDIIRLEARFVLPVIVTAMLKGEEDLDDIAEYAINEMLDEFYPDTALLCMALCARHIAAGLDDILISKALIIEANHILEDYGQHWLSEKVRDLSNDLEHDELLAHVHHIPEDLEALADLFDATIHALDEKHMVASILLDIFSDHARFQQKHAEDLLEKLSLQPDLPAYVLQQEKKYISEGDNVIPFPLSRTKE